MNQKLCPKCGYPLETCFDFKSSTNMSLYCNRCRYVESEPETVDAVIEGQL